MVKAAMAIKEQLTNGITVTYHDESRRIAADRWLVKLRCEASLPWQAWMDEVLSGDPQEQAAFCRQFFDGRLCYETVRERNFIDETEKEKLFRELCRSFADNALRYLEREDFVRQLFVTRRSEYVEQYLLLQQSQYHSLVDDGNESPEPTDFSACFQ